MCIGDDCTSHAVADMRRLCTTMHLILSENCCFEHNIFHVHLNGIDKIFAHSNVRGTCGSRIIATMHHENIRVIQSVVNLIHAWGSVPIRDSCSIECNSKDVVTLVLFASLC